MRPDASRHLETGCNLDDRAFLLFTSFTYDLFNDAFRSPNNSITGGQQTEEGRGLIRGIIPPLSYAN
jgi:hypothetical protein